MYRKPHLLDERWLGGPHDLAARVMPAMSALATWVSVRLPVRVRGCGVGSEVFLPRATARTMASPSCAQPQHVRRKATSDRLVISILILETSVT